MLNGIHSIEPANTDVLLDTCEVELDDGKTKIRGAAKIMLRLLPRPRIAVEVEADCEFFEALKFTINHFSEQQLTLRIPTKNFETQAMIVKSKQLSKSDKLFLTVCPMREPLEIGSHNAKLSHVVFNLLNFREFTCESHVVKSPSGSSHLLGHAVLKGGGWQIQLDSQLSTKDAIEDLQNTGGYAITHIGRIERENRKYFTPDEADNVLECLHYFLSFSRGFWVQPILSIGFDGDEEVWRKVGVSISDPWCSALSWFDDVHSSFAELFLNFWEIWNNPIWKKELSSAIYWYLRSNTQVAGTDGSLILTQAALELLAWVYIVEDKRLLSKDGFKRLSAADQIRMLISSLDLDIDIPDQTKLVRSLAGEFNWQDGPQALTEIRNGIVHPNHPRGDRLAGMVIFEAWNLGQWYIELIILRLLGHKGVYADRLTLSKWRGEVRTIPSRA